MVNLLLSGCIERLRRVREQELFTEALFREMKSAGSILNAENFKGGADKIPKVLEELRSAVEGKRQQKKEAELLTKDEEKRLLRLEETLLSYENTLKAESSESGPAAFEILRRLFGEQRARYAGEQESGSGALEHAFDFLEAAFGDSQEMVIFLTGLNMSEAAVAFLQTTDCERYERYNKRLLFSESDREIREEIARLK